MANCCILVLGFLSLMTCACSAWLQAPGTASRNLLQEAPVADGALRLVGGNSTTGRLEVHHNGIWGTICKDRWADTAANAGVACRQLGLAYDGATLATINVSPPSSGPIWLDDVVCQGSEVQLVNCNHTDWNGSNCMHTEDVELNCKQAVPSPPPAPPAPPPSGNPLVNSPPPVVVSPNPNSGSGDGSGGSSTNVGAIIGGTVTGVALLCLLAFALVIGIRRRRQRLEGSKTWQEVGNEESPLGFVVPSNGHESGPPPPGATNGAALPVPVNEAHPNRAPAPPINHSPEPPADIGRPQPTPPSGSLIVVPDSIKNWNLLIDSDELTVKEKLGSGGFGEVYKGMWRSTPVAIKLMTLDTLEAADIERVKTELQLMFRMRHPNIVQLLGAAVMPSGHFAIVLELVMRGSLYHILHKSKEQLDARKRLRIALDIAKGMEYLHGLNPPVVHRDVKSLNLLVTTDWRIKVCDFGMSKLKKGDFLTTAHMAGTPAWMAPEVLKGEPCDEKSDVYSYGMVLYELVTGKLPFPDVQHTFQLVHLVGNLGQRPDLPADLDPKVADLINSCWLQEAVKRPSFQDILQVLRDMQQLPLAPSLARQAPQGGQQGSGSEGLSPPAS